MVDIGVPSAASSGADAATALKARRDDTGRNGGSGGKGFLDALTSAHGSRLKAGADDSSGHAEDRPDATLDLAQDDSLVEKPAPSAVSRQQVKPMIDLQGSSIKEQPPQVFGEVLAASQKPMSKGQRQTARTSKDTTAGTSAGHDAEAVKDGAKSRDTDTHGKAAKNRASSSVDEDGAEPAETRPKDAATHALSLLHGQSAGDAPVSAQGAAVAFVASAAHSVQPGRASKDTPRIETEKDGSSARLPAHIADAASDTDGGSSGQTVRLVRADGRGQALEMSVGKGNGEDAEQFDVKAASGGPTADTVTVLDSRRYLGLAPGSNAAAVVGALGGDPEWSGAMDPSSALSNAAAWTGTGKVVNTLKIEMHPADLGVVTATMRLHGDELTVDLKVQSGEAYRQLNSDQSHMMETLRSQGYSVDRITVTLAAPDQADAGSQSGFQGQSQQQSLPNQAQGGEAQSRERNYPGQQANGNDGGWGRGEAAAEESASGGSQRGRSGGVYL